MNDTNDIDKETIAEINSFFYHLLVKASSLFVWYTNTVNDVMPSGIVRVNTLTNKSIRDMSELYFRLNEIDAQRAGEDVYIRTVDDTEIMRVVNERSQKRGLDLTNARLFRGLVQITIFCYENFDVAFSEAEAIHQKISRFEDDNSEIDGVFRIVGIGRNEQSDWVGKNRDSPRGFQAVAMTYSYVLAKIA